MGSSCTKHKPAKVVSNHKDPRDLLPPALDPTSIHSTVPVPTQTAESQLRGPQRFFDKSQNRLLDPRRNNEEIHEAHTAEVLDRPKSKNELKMILICLNKHFLLKNLDLETKEYLSSCMRFYTVKARELIVEQGHRALSFYVIASGRCEVIVNGNRKDVIRSGSGFGELALLDNSPRTATIRSMERCTLWGLDRETFQRALKRLNELNFGENTQFINSVPLLEMLTEEQKALLVSSMNTQWWNAGEKIVKEGDIGDLFYIIKEGTVSCSGQGKALRNLEKGEYFGELALLYNWPRTATVTCLTDVKVVSIGRAHLIEALGGDLDQVIYRNTQRISLNRSEVLKVLSKEQIEAALNKVENVTFHDGEIVIAEGTKRNSIIYMVLKGTISTGRHHFETFSCIGDQSLHLCDGALYTENYYSSGETHVARISREDFEAAIGGNFAQIINFNEILRIFRQVPLLRGLPSEKVQELMTLMKTQEFSAGELIVQQNTPGDSFYIVKSGTVEILVNDVVVRSISRFDYFGERSVLFDDIRTASVTCKDKVVCWMLHKDNFSAVIDPVIRDQLLKRIDLQDDSIQLQDLVPVKPLGKGMFGTVHLTVHKEKQTLYALKTVSRSKVVAHQIYEHILHERKILLQLDHPMIMKLVKTFKDEKRVYFLLEYVQGMDLFDVLRVLNLVKESDAKFYVGCLILVMEYLHEGGIVYRDLKPENVMVDEEGYPKLIDFGTAKIVKGRTYTAIGTPHYMAPEVILGSGYSQAVDWWSVGVMLYEFLYGGLPFGEEENDPQRVYEKVIEQRILYPNYADPMSPVRHLIQQLLAKNPNARTGGTPEKLKTHKWFSNFSWNLLLTKQAKAPFVPKLNNLKDQVAKVLKAKRGLPEYLHKEEGNIEVEARRNKNRAPPTDWDAVF